MTTEKELKKAEIYYRLPVGVWFCPGDLESLRKLFPLSIITEVLQGLAKDSLIKYRHHQYGEADEQCVTKYLREKAELLPAAQRESWATCADREKFLTEKQPGL